MHRAQPVANQVCYDKWQERQYKIHRQKLQKIKSSVDNKAPQLYPHLYQKLKKAQMEEDRCTIIERDNRTLVKRMTDLMQKSALDTHNHVEYRSLNKERRRRELVKITQENMALLKRLQQRPPTYNHLVWEQQRERNEALCDRICRYPYRPARPASASGDQPDAGAGYYAPPADGAGYASQPASSGGAPGYAAPAAPGSQASLQHSTSTMQQSAALDQSKATSHSHEPDDAEDDY